MRQKNIRRNNRITTITISATMPPSISPSSLLSLVIVKTKNAFKSWDSLTNISRCRISISIKLMTLVLSSLSHITIHLWEWKVATDHVAPDHILGWPSLVRDNRNLFSQSGQELTTLTNQDNKTAQLQTIYVSVQIGPDCPKVSQKLRASFSSTRKEKAKCDGLRGIPELSMQYIFTNYLLIEPFIVKKIFWSWQHHRCWIVRVYLAENFKMHILERIFHSMYVIPIPAPAVMTFRG